MNNAGLISKTDQNIYQTAMDISRHFAGNWEKTTQAFILALEEWWFVLKINRCKIQESF